MSEIQPFKIGPVRKDHGDPRTSKATLPSLKALTGEARVLLKKIKDLGYGNGIPLNQIGELPPELIGIKTTKHAFETSKRGHMTLEDMVIRELMYHHSGGGISKSRKFRTRAWKAMQSALEKLEQRNQSLTSK